MDHNKVDNTKSIEYVFRMDLTNIVIWIAIWGIFDNVLNIFVPDDHYYVRIIIYIILLVIMLQVKFNLY